jgi:hypothetical protein
MYVGKDFPLMNPDEVLDHTFDFVDDLDATETINGAVFTLDAYSGTDAAASSHLIGPPTINGLKVTQVVSGLLDGVTYRLRCKATTSSGKVVGDHSFLTCKAPAGTDT